MIIVWYIHNKKLTMCILQMLQNQIYLQTLKCLLLNEESPLNSKEKYYILVLLIKSAYMYTSCHKNIMCIQISALHSGPSIGPTNPLL